MITLRNFVVSFTQFIVDKMKKKKVALYTVKQPNHISLKYHGHFSVLLTYTTLVCD